MTRVYLADAKTDERSALRLLLLDLHMEVVGEAADWPTTLAQAPIRRTDMLLVDWDLFPNAPNAALEELRKACPAALVTILISQLDARLIDRSVVCGRCMPIPTLREKARGRMNFPTDNNKSPVNRTVQFLNILHTVRNIARWIIGFFALSEADRLNAGIYIGSQGRNE